jgi:hypothetical protein
MNIKYKIFNNKNNIQIKFMKYSAVLILVLSIFSGIAQAQLFPNLGGQRAGISTAQSLKIPVGARAAGMGDAFIAVANDASALYWNPAGITQYDKNDVLFSHNEWFVGVKSEFVGAVYHLSANDAIGVSVSSLHMEDMEVTSETNPFGTGEYFSFGDLTFGLTYSRKMTTQFGFGFTVKYFNENMAGLRMGGLLVDLGTYYWTGLGTTRFSVAVNNFGSELKPSGDLTRYGGTKVTDFQSFSPPTLFKIGFAFEPIDLDVHRLTASIQLNHPNDNAENVSLGAEYAWNKIVMFRAGYKFNVDEENFSLGAGARVPLGFTDLNFDYAYVHFLNLGSTHRISLIVSF